MASPEEHGPELLVLCCEPRTGDLLASELASRGVGTDVVASLADARTAFFQRGGHDALVLVADLPLRLAERAVAAMRELDPDLTIIAFGHDLARAELPDCTTRLREFHPTSRAGVGAIMRAIATLG